MTLSVDGFLSKIGSMGRFQWTLVCVVGIMLVPVTFQTLIMTFLALEPPWRCVQNSTVCNFTRKYVILNGFVHSKAQRNEARVHMGTVFNTKKIAATYHIVEKRKKYTNFVFLDRSYQTRTQNSIAEGAQKAFENKSLPFQCRVSKKISFRKRRGHRYSCLACF